MQNDRKNTVLLIDADASVTKKLADRLNSVGFNVLSATTEDTALAMIEAGQPDIILLDTLVGGKEGQDLLTVIKSNSNFSNIPVIVLSSDTDVNSKVYSFLSGANDYIVKPFRFPEVLARVNTQLRILQMQKELEEKNKELLEKNVLLQQMAMTDDLTGLYNKGYILTRLGSEISHAARYREHISFIMLDIDHFKKVNDTYGHLAGDILLKEIAKQLTVSVREADITARYGGEEFLIVCPNTDLMGTIILAERIRRGIERTTFRLEKHKLRITVSMGISSTVPAASEGSPESEVKTLIGEADIALYRAKANGRNRVEIHTANMSLPQNGEKVDTPTRLDKYTH